MFVQMIWARFSSQFLGRSPIVGPASHRQGGQACPRCADTPTFAKPELGFLRTRGSGVSVHDQVCKLPLPSCAALFIVLRTDLSAR